MVIHEVKTWPEFFDDLERGLKLFEVRRNDRNYQPGQYLHHREYDPFRSAYTGRQLWQKITYILHGPQFGIEAGYCVMAVTNEVPGVPAPAEDYDDMNPADCRRAAASKVGSAAGLCASAVGALADEDNPATYAVRRRLMKFRHELNLLYAQLKEGATND